MRLVGLGGVVALAFSLAACGGNGGETETVRVEGTEYAYVTPGSIAPSSPWSRRVQPASR